MEELVADDAVHIPDGQVHGADGNRCQGREDQQPQHDHAYKHIKGLALEPPFIFDQCALSHKKAR